MSLFTVVRAAGGAVGCLLFVLVLVTSVSAPAAGAPRSQAGEPDLAAIDRYIEQEMAAARLPGLAIGVVRGDGVVHLRGFGRADPGGRAVTPETLFTIGSTGKSITALAVMQLVEAGKLDLDRPVRDYVADFRTGDAAGTELITTRHLLTHSSGYGGAAGLELVGRENRGEEAVDEQIRILQNTSLHAAPGERHEYSNANYIWLGQVIEAASGQSYEAYVREHILEPLDMDTTSLSLDEAEARGLATGHRYWFGRPTPYRMPYHRSALPAGFIHSTAEEMSRYLIMLLNGGEYEGRRVLSEEGVEALHSPHVFALPAPRPGVADAHYGFGWYVTEVNGAPTIYHGGSTGTFHANLVLLPEHDLALVLLMNGENALDGGRIGSLAIGITSLLVGESPPPPSTGGLQQSVLRVVLVAMVVQLLGMGRSIRRLLRWRRDPASRPNRALPVVRSALLSFVFNAAWALAMLRVIPGLLGGTLRFHRHFAPDFGNTLLLTGLIALAWALVHPALLWWLGDGRGLTARRDAAESAQTGAAETPRWGVVTGGAWRRGRR